MSESVEEVREHIKLYWKIGAALMVLTVVTVAIAYIDFSVPVAIFVALVVAATKGSLVSSYFMHLIGERKWILGTLLLTVLFFIVLIFIPLMGHLDTYGNRVTVPNSNAESPSEVAH
tara:strand:- start:266 stop:616 length:351 start_codon:yes stop_codon:yes gene_type:complete